MLIYIIHWVCLWAVSCHAGCCCVTYISFVSSFCFRCVWLHCLVRACCSLCDTTKSHGASLYHRMSHKWVARIYSSFLLHPEVNGQLLSWPLLMVFVCLNAFNTAGSSPDFRVQWIPQPCTNSTYLLFFTMNLKSAFGNSTLIYNELQPMTMFTDLHKCRGPLAHLAPWCVLTARRLTSLCLYNTPQENLCD